MRTTTSIVVSLGLLAATGGLLQGQTAMALPVTPVLAYAKPVAGVPTIFTSAVDGKGAQARIAHAGAVTVSPDTRHLAYVTNDGHVAVATVTGGSKVSLLVTTSFGGMSWAPDSVRLVVAQANGLWIVNTVTHASSLIPGTAGQSKPQWSPDGTLIAARAANLVDQVVQEPSGASRVVRKNMPTGPWSPDGRHMLEVAPSSNAFNAVDVLTGARQSMAFLRESYSYLGAAWAPSNAGTLAAYLSIDSWLPWSPGTTTLYRFEAVDGGPSGTTTGSAQIADKATDPSAGGISVTDSNGAPGPVRGLNAWPSPSAVNVQWTPPAATADYAGAEVRWGYGSPPATVTSGIPGGRVLGNQLMLEPMPSSETIYISVFSRDWSGHVGPPATVGLLTSNYVATTLTATVSPTTITSGGSATITLRLREKYGSFMLPYQPIDIAIRPLGSTSPFTTIGLVRTSKTGVAIVRQAPSSGREYRFTFNGVADDAGTSVNARISVRPRATLTASSLHGPPGSLVTLTMRTAPALSNVKTYLQRHTTSWATVGPHNTNPAGTVTYSVRIPARCTTITYRVYLPASPGYVATNSNYITLTGD